MKQHLGPEPLPVRMRALAISGHERSVDLHSAADLFEESYRTLARSEEWNAAVKSDKSFHDLPQHLLEPFVASFSHAYNVYQDCIKLKPGQVETWQ